MKSTGFFPHLSRGVTRCARAAMLAACLAGTKMAAESPPDIAPEYTVKAAFLVRFAQYTVWPDAAFASNRAPIVIGVLGADPFGKTLAKTAESVTNGRPVRVLHLDRPADAGQCQLVFISGAESDHEADWLDALRDKPILTVGESGHTLDRGGVIEFAVIDTHIRFNVDWAEMKRAGLKITSPMLVSARKVRNAPDPSP